MNTLKTKIALGIFFALLILPGNLAAQAPEIIWSKTYGGSQWDGDAAVCPTADGGFVLLGSASSIGLGDIWLLRTNAAGDTLWSRSYGGPGSIEAGYDVQETGDGGFVIAGYTESFGNGDDAWFLRTDAAGDTLWSFTLGERDSYEWVKSVVETQDGGFLFAGQREKSPGGDSDLWLVRTDAAGDTLWTRTYGGSYNDMGFAAIQTGDGGFAVTGYFSPAEDNSDLLLLRTNTDGDSLWSRTFGHEGEDLGYDLRETDDGGFILAGTLMRADGQDRDAWLIRTDPAGNSLWERSFGGYQENEAFAVEQTADGGFVWVGSTESAGGSMQLWVMRTDHNGVLLWNRTLGGSGREYGLDVHQVADGGYVISGETSSLGAGQSDFWLLRLGADSSAQGLPDLPLINATGNVEIWNDQIFLIGGASHWWGGDFSQGIYRLDPSGWVLHDSIPDNMVWGMESALVDNNLYLLNGWRNGRGLNRQYDMGSGSWNYLASSVNPSSWGNTVEVWNNRLYLITIPEFVFEYDIAANTWTQKGNTPDLGFPGLRSVIVGDDIYVLGYRQHLFYKYTPASDTWTPLAEPPYSVAGCAMELYNGRIFCVGGSVDGGPHVGADIYKSVISYDILSDSWRYENLQISTPRIWMASAVYNDQLYVFGGFDSTAYAVDIVETLTPAPVLTGLAEDKPVAIPGGFTLEQNYPNPFNPTTSIGFSLPTAARVRLEIFDVLGRRLATPLGEGFRTFSAGRHEVRWNGRSQSGAALPSGIYFYRMAYQAAGGGQESGGELTRQMLLLK